MPRTTIPSKNNEILYVRIPGYVNVWLRSTAARESNGFAVGGFQPDGLREPLHVRLAQ